MKTIEITHGNKIMFPKSGITKKDLAHYYEEISPFMLPYLKDRPLTLHRFPEGIHHNGFFQKNASHYFPQWVTTVEIKKEGGWVNQVVCDSKDTLLYLVNQGVITFHISLSKKDKMDYPDRLIFDLDPPENNFHKAIKSALILRGFLEGELKLQSYPMATGSQGIHVVLPLLRKENFDEARNFAKSVAMYLAQKHPEDFTTAIRKDKRGGKLFLDYLRNSYAQTAVCPYSVRALEGAPVSTPLEWDELGKDILSSRAYDIHNVFKRLKTLGDPWKTFYTRSNIIADANKTLEKLLDFQRSHPEKNLD